MNGDYKYLDFASTYMNGPPAHIERDQASDMKIKKLQDVILRKDQEAEERQILVQSLKDTIDRKNKIIKILKDKLKEDSRNYLSDSW